MPKLQTKTIMIFSLFMLFAFFAMAKGAEAANHYINASCSSACDGSTWAKGWATFGAASWTRGDTYYVAGGTYNEAVTVAVAASGSTLMTIKKANAADNSGDAGWSAAYATTQAVINGTLAIYNSYITVDGVTGSANSGHGIKINSSATSGYVVDVSDQSFVTLSHLEIRGAGYSAATDYRGVGAHGADSKGLHFSYLYVHEVTTNGYTFGGNAGTSFSDYGLLFENNYQERTGGCTNANLHGQGIQVGYAQTQTYWIIRNSVIKDALGSAYIAFLGYGNNDNIYIYNNIFYATNRSTYNASPGVIWAHELASMDDLRIYNNTFYNISLSRVAIDASGSTRELKNNIFHTGYFNYTHGGVTESNNAYYGNTGGGTYPYGVPVGTAGQQNETSDPVASAANGNFILVSGAKSINNGENLSNYFTTDFAGNARSGVFDIGAYEYVSGGGDTTPPTAPQGLSVE